MNKGQGCYGSYQAVNFIDGEGVRCSLYVSGCTFRCQECYNPQIQDFSFGEVYTPALEVQIMKDLAQPFIQGLSLLGGEPFQNLAICLPLVQRIKRVFGSEKDIWIWSGHQFEQLQGAQRLLLEQVDILVDGPFQKEKKQANLFFRGSANQRIIDVQGTLKAGQLSLWQDGAYLLKEKG